VELMKDYTDELVETAETEELKAIMTDRCQEKRKTLKVPFTRTKTNSVVDFMYDLQDKSIAIDEKTAEIEAAIKNAGSKASIEQFKKALLMDFKPHVDEKKNKEVNMDEVNETIGKIKKGLGDFALTLGHKNGETKSFDNRVEEHKKKFKESGHHEDDLNKMEEFLHAHKEYFHTKTHQESESKAEYLLKYFKILRGADEEENLMKRYPGLVHEIAKKKIIDVESPNFDRETIRAEFEALAKENGTGNIAVASALAAILFSL